MDSILNWYREEGIIFKGGSGSGINLSKIRSSFEPLEGGGTASGPVSFMRGADASAGTIKSGGKTRRAAKMVILDVDHPDVEEFVWCKVKEERKARVLRDNGFDMDLDGADSYSIQYQNANNSVRVSPTSSCRPSIDDADWGLTAVTTGEVIKTVRARDLWMQIAQASWECADPGPAVRHHDQPLAHRARHRPHQRQQPVLGVHAPRRLGLQPGVDQPAQVPRRRRGARHLRRRRLHAHRRGRVHRPGDPGRPGRLPDPAIGETSRNFRQLGLGYANLGALLMALGKAYDSPEGRAWAAALTSLMTGHAYATSARTAARMGPFAGFAENEEHMLRVLRMHRDASYEIDVDRRRWCPPTCWPPGSAPGSPRCATARSTACATARPRCSPRPAPSG
jgi:ribonucleoside-diphosphate reductase alpha chain